MLTSTHLRRPLVALSAALLFTVACGGSSSPKPTAASTDTNSQTSQQTSSSSGSDTDSSSSSSGSSAFSAPLVFDATYQRGSGHLEISGSASRTADFTQAAGYTTSGTTAVTFTDAQGQNALVLTSSTNTGESSGITVTVGGITTGGEFGKECQLTITKNEASEFAGKIQCTNVEGVEGNTVHSGLNVAATFSTKA